MILGVSVAVSGVPCPSLGVTGASVAAEVGTGVGVLRFDILIVIVPVLEIFMLRETTFRSLRDTDDPEAISRSGRRG